MAACHAGAAARTDAAHRCALEEVLPSHGTATFRKGQGVKALLVELRAEGRQGLGESSDANGSTKPTQEETMLARLRRRDIATSLLAMAAVTACLSSAQTQALSGQPITIGFGMALTGPLAGFGKQALLGMKIWEEETNAKAGLLGRPVKLIYYDDQSNPSTVPGIYTKLLDVDKVDLVLSGN